MSMKMSFKENCKRTYALMLKNFSFVFRHLGETNIKIDIGSQEAYHVWMKIVNINFKEKIFQESSEFAPLEFWRLRAGPRRGRYFGVECAYKVWRGACRPRER